MARAGLWAPRSPPSARISYRAPVGYFDSFRSADRQARYPDADRPGRAWSAARGSTRRTKRRRYEVAMIALAETLREARQNAGLTQRQVADALAVPHTYPSRWER